MLSATFLGLPDEAGPYALVIGLGFVVGIYAHAAKMPRLLAVAIFVVVVASMVAILVSFSYDGSAPRVKP
ncbi:MAG: hypothetical protein KDB58_10805 [Solirubrobacterales bacterium]|nr:hypothetical protein [Solirubrobacterales bacterium]MCB8969354.1 hypothetical protein [Thermoleophilales bacterium]MCO5327816.1 hypothetical protein [Solirubrobacterales bacterium]